VARQRPNPINVIGQFSPAVGDVTANMNNRLLAAMQERGATQRQGMANQSQQIIAGMGERGATERAQMGEAGATQRARIGQQTQAASDQNALTMSREQSAASDRQNAAQIRANRENREFQARQQESLIRLGDELDWARTRYHESIAREDRDAEMQYRQQVLDLEKKTSIMSFALQTMNMQTMMRTIQKMYGSEEADARLEDGLSRMADERRASLLASAGTKKAVQNRVEALAPGTPFESVFAEAMTTQQETVSADLLFDPEKMAAYLADGDLNKYLAVQRSLDAIETASATRKEKAEKTPKTTYRESRAGLPYEVPTSRATDLAAAEGAVKKVQQARDNLSALFRSARPLANGQGTLGQQLLAFEEHRSGHTSSAIALEAKNRGLIPEQLRLDLLNFYMNGMPDTSWLWDPWPDIAPEMKDWLRSQMQPLMNVLNPQTGLEPQRFAP